LITIKISKRLKIEKYKGKGLRIFINLKGLNKWISLRLTEREVNLLIYIIKIIYP